MQTKTEIEEASFGGVKELTGRRYKVRLIEGNKLGSTGYYPAEVLRRDGPRIFTKGTPMYLDHQLPDEKILRPFGSVTTFAGELAEDAYYEGDGLYSEIEVFEHQMPLIKSLKDKIGISIRAQGYADMQTINGRPTKVFSELIEARSADFVVKAGAGGKIVSILESAELDSEAPSEVEEGRENMDEVLEALKSFESKFDSRLTKIEEGLAATAPALVEEAKVETVDVDAKALEIAEAFVSSSLDAEGRQRVLDMHRANGKDLKDLIAAEEAYVKKNAAAAPEVEGVEESAAAEKSTETIEESARQALPSAWKKKDK